MSSSRLLSCQLLVLGALVFFILTRKSFFRNKLALLCLVVRLAHGAAAAHHGECHKHLTTSSGLPVPPVLVPSYPLPSANVLVPQSYPTYNTPSSTLASYPLPTGNLSTTSHSASPSTLSTGYSSGTPAPTSVPQYGSNVDTTDTAPDPLATPAVLPTRPEKTIGVTGIYTDPFTGALGGSNLLVRLGNLLAISII